MITLWNEIFKFKASLTVIGTVADCESRLLSITQVSCSCRSQLLLKVEEGDVGVHIGKPHVLCWSVSGFLRRVSTVDDFERAEICLVSKPFLEEIWLALIDRFNSVQGSFRSFYLSLRLLR